MWNIEKIVSKGEYNYAIVRDHPNRTKNDYVLHHRVVMENYLGRLLTSEEVVHHKNGDKKDNRIKNLEIMSNKEHASKHSNERCRKTVVIRCPNCDKIVEKDYHKIQKEIKKGYMCCNIKCGNSFRHKLEKNPKKFLPKTKKCIIKTYKKIK